MTDIENDQNYQRYQELLRDDNWYSEHEGNFIVLVDGEVVDEDNDKDTLFSRIGESHPDKEGYFTQVSREERVVRFRRPRRVIRS